MRTNGKTMRIPMGWSYSAILLLGCFATAAWGEVFPIDLDAFGPGAVVEDFEGIVGVELPAIPDFPIAAELPIPWDFESGVTLRSANPEREASVFDFALDPPGSPDYGWGLSMDGGNITYTTEIPSPTSLLTHNTSQGSGEVAPLVLEFDPPVAKVGFFGEAAIFYMIGHDGSITLEAFGLDNESLGLVEVFADGAGMNNMVDPPVDLGPVDTWIGLMASEPIWRVAVVGRYLVMDSLIFESSVVSIETRTWGDVKSLYR